jgi:hypothetical protein
VRPVGGTGVVVFDNDTHWWCMYHTSIGSVAAKIGSPLESDLSMYFLQIQKGPTDLLKGFPGNT